MFDRITWYLVILAALLIAAVYYKGVTTDINAFSGAFNSGFLSVTGRNPTGGQFQNVP